MIAGTMPKWQQYGHRAPAVVVAFMGVWMWWGFHMVPSLQTRGHNYFAIIFLLALAFGVGSIIWFWKKLIKEFSYDGRTLTFNTLANPGTQVQDLSAVERVADWTGRGGTIGLSIKFRNGPKVYLHYGVPNAAAAAAQIRSDLGRLAPEKIASTGRRRVRLAAVLAIAIAVGGVAAVATLRFMAGLPPVISRAEFLSEVDQQHVSKVVITDRDLISGTSSTRGPFRVQTPVDDAMVEELRSRGLVVEFEASSDLIP